MKSVITKICLPLAATLPLSMSSSIGCCKKPPVVSVARIPTSCLEAVGDRPALKFKPNTRPPGCPAAMACFDVEAMIALSRWMRETLLWMEQVELSCSEEIK